MPYKSAAIRAFYFDLIRARARALDLDLALALDLARDLDLDLNLDLAKRISAKEFYHALQDLKDRLPDRSLSRDEQKRWWQTNEDTWMKELRQVMIEHRNMGHDWQFTDDQKQRLQQYYEANKLLVDCLNSEIYVSRSVRQDIEESLLLPIAPLPSDSDAIR